MTKKKIFFAGFASALVIVFLTFYAWDKIKYQAFDVWSYYPDAEKLEADILEKYPIGTPVSWVSRALNRANLDKAIIGIGEKGTFNYVDSGSCCDVIYHSSKENWFRNKHRGISVRIEFNIDQKITALTVSMGEAPIQWAP